MKGGNTPAQEIDSVIKLKKFNTSKLQILHVHKKDDDDYDDEEVFKTDSSRSKSFKTKSL